MEEPDFNYREGDSPVLYRFVFAVDGMGYFLKPVRETECSVGDYPIPGSRVIDVHDW